MKEISALICENRFSYSSYPRIFRWIDRIALVRFIQSNR